MKKILAIGVSLAILILPAHADDRTTPINITKSTTATTGNFNVSLPAVSGVTNYLCGFIITSGGTSSALVVNATASGTITGTMNFSYVFPSTGQGVLGVAFPQCIAASAQNTAITVTVPGGGAGTTAALSAWGYQL